MAKTEKIAFILEQVILYSGCECVSKQVKTISMYRMQSTVAISLPISFTFDVQSGT